MRNRIFYLSLCMIFALSMLACGVYMLNDFNCMNSGQIETEEKQEESPAEGLSGTVTAYIKLYKNGKLESLTNGYYQLKLYGYSGPSTLIATGSGGSLTCNLSTVGSSYFYTYLTVSQTQHGGEEGAYVFSGWYSSSSCTGAPDLGTTSSSNSITASKTLYARYNYSSSSFYLDNMGGSTNGYMYATYGQAYPKVDVPTKNGYTFDGYWDIPVGAAGQRYYTASGSPTISYCSYNYDKTRPTLYARWVANTYTITYKPNGGTPNTDYTQSVTYGRSFTAKSPDTYTRTGHALKDWNTQANGSGTTYDCNASYRYNIASNLTLYAQWVVTSYILDVNGNLDGTVSGSVNGYATFDMYINGSKVATQVADYNAAHPYGTSYEVKNIKPSNDKQYLSAYHNNECTISGSLSGTVPAENRIVCLKMRTKTWNDYAASSYAGGRGTAADPYIIKTAEQLAKVAKDSRSSTLSGKYYKLAADIDLSSHVWEGIGNTAYRFAGIFDGKYYQIKGMKTAIDYYQAPEEIGLFCYVQNPCVIKNIVINGAMVTPGKTRDCGIIVGAGESSGMLISNCIVVSSTMQGGNANCSYGGIVGRFTNGTISNCLTKSVNLYVEGTAAGICGWRGTIKDCAVIGGDISSSWDLTNRKVAVGWSDNATIISSYGYVFQAKDRIIERLMYGGSTAWGNWTYNEQLNEGYPLPKELLHIGGIDVSANVYNYLKNLGFSEA